MRRLIHPVRLAVLLCAAVLVAVGVAASAAAAPPTFGTASQAIHEQRDDSEGDDETHKTCTPISVETTDYLLDVVSTLPNYFGLPAKIDIHRVRPVYKNDACSHRRGPRHAAILLHGRTLDASGFDVPSRLVGVFSINPACPGQRDPNILAPLWASIRARDPIGASWGSADPATGGVFRWPTAIRWG
jgi:hypothetical protein